MFPLFFEAVICFKSALTRQVHKLLTVEFSSLTQSVPFLWLLAHPAGHHSQCPFSSRATFSLSPHCTRLTLTPTEYFLPGRRGSEEHNSLFQSDKKSLTSAKRGEIDFLLKDAVTPIPSYPVPHDLEL